MYNGNAMHLLVYQDTEDKRDDDVTTGCINPTSRTSDAGRLSARHVCIEPSASERRHEPEGISKAKEIVFICVIVKCIVVVVVPF